MEAVATRLTPAANRILGVRPEPVRWPLMKQDWLRLSFVHWSYPPEEVRWLLPNGIELETFDGCAWVGLVLFRLRVRFPFGPPIPWLGSFPEVNVRTYVRGPDGESGIWFFSLDARGGPAPTVARALYSLPYRRATIEVTGGESLRRYTLLRREGRARGAICSATVSAGAAVEPEDVSALEHFLTARWRLYTSGRRGLGCARVEHPPWVLRRGVVSDLDTSLLRAAGLGAPHSQPLAHACDDLRAALTPLRPGPEHGSWTA
jgi:uncharacterized protein YqjF (DUF2071 family)